MKTDEIIYSLQNMVNRKMRSFLSVISIMIGITAIFALVSFGLGIQSYVDDLAEEAGTDKLFIQARGVGAPGTDDSFYISQDDVDFVSKINGVDRIAGLYFKTAEIEYEEETSYYFIIGLDPDQMEFLLEAFTIEIIDGRNLKDGDSDKAVLGYNYQLADRIFEEPVRLRDEVLINGEEFEVVGFYEEVGNPADDAQIYVLPETMEQLYPETEDQYGYAVLKTEKGVDPEVLADRINERLRKHKGQDEGEEDFYVQTFSDAIAIFNNIFGIINGVLILIALISVVVASVNIMNTMYTAVLERTKEIGIMKAVGARNENILFIFIFESGLLGTIGGILGVGLGYLIARTGAMIAADAGYSLLQPVFPWYLIAGCIVFSFLVGAGSGLLPAIRASKQKPVDSLRYE